MAFNKPPEKWPQGLLVERESLLPQKEWGAGVHSYSAIGELAGDVGESSPPSNGPGHLLKMALASSRKQAALLHLPSTGSPGSCLQLRGADPAPFPTAASET